MNKNLSQKGFSTLELMVALGILIMTFTAIILVIFSNQTVSIDTEIVTSALSEAKNQIEEAKIQSRNDFVSLDGISTSSFDIFERTLDANPINSCRTDVTSTINWSTDPMRPGEISLTTNVINTAEAQALGGQCGPTNPPTGWDTLVCNDPDTEWDDNPTLDPTGIDLIKRGTTTYAIITSNPSSGPRDDFYVVNVTNKASLSSFTSIDLDPGLNDVDAVGNYAFVARNSTNQELQVINITDPLAPILITTASRSLTAVGAGSEGKKIYYYDDKVYIGTDYMVSYDEFQIFDVTDPTNPSLTPLGTYNVNHNIYEIIVRDRVIAGITKRLAYLSVSGDNTKPKLVILDVTDPSSITELSSFSPSPNDSLYGTALFALGKNIYLGRERATGNQKDIFFLNYDGASPPTVLYSENLNLNNNNEVRDIRGSGNLLFISVSKSNASDQDTFQVWDISNIDNIVKTKCNYPQDAVSFEFDGNFAYVINSSNEALRIVYDAANPFPN